MAIWMYGSHIHLLAVPATDTALTCGIGMTDMLYTQVVVVQSP